MTKHIEKLAREISEAGLTGIDATDLSAALKAAGLEVKPCASCQACKHWDIANASVGLDRLATRYDWDADGDPLYKPPHADLNWSHCNAAPEGFDVASKEEADQLYASTMAVFDGSAYHAELLTRFDHSCSQFEARTAAALTKEG